MGKRLVKSALLAMACVAFIGVMAMSANAAGTFSLNIQFDKDDLERLYAEGMQVVLVKETADTDAENSSSPVVWTTFYPFENNVVEWDDDYAVYASNSTLKMGQTVDPLTNRNAVPTVAYGFQKGVFENPRIMDFIDADEYVIQNCQNEGTVSIFGLAQSLTVNGQRFESSPINAVEIFFGEYHRMVPTETVKIYLSKNTDRGMILQEIPKDALEITYDEDATEHTVVYDGASGQFKMME